MDHDLASSNHLELIEYAENAIEKIRIRKLEASNIFEEIFRIVNKSYEKAIETLDEYIAKLEKLIGYLKNENVGYYFEYFRRVQKPEFFIIIPPFIHKLKEKYFDVFQLEEPQGILRIKDVKIECGHPISSFFDSSCGKTHCFSCMNNDFKNTVNFDEYINIPPPINETDKTSSEPIRYKCPCGNIFTKREMVIFKYLSSKK